MGARKIQTTKLSQHVAFPVSLDVTPYLSQTLISPPNKVDANSANNKPWHSSTSTAHMYDLFAVVNHQGSMDSGHYTAFVLQQLPHGATEWVKCDDSAVTRATVAQVQASEAYLLFYCKRYMEYAPGDK